MVIFLIILGYLSFTLVHLFTTLHIKGASLIYTSPYHGLLLLPTNYYHHYFITESYYRIGKHCLCLSQVSYLLE